MLATPPLQVSTPGSRGKSLITQIYFRDRVPGQYEEYLLTRDAQFGRVSARPRHGGRIVQFNVRMDV